MARLPKAAVASLFAAREAEVSGLFPRRQQVSWVPVLPSGDTKFRLGVLEDGDWAIEDDEGLRRLSAHSSYLWGLALLEHPIGQLRTELRTRSESWQLTFDLAERFPYSELIRAGLDQKSDYWAQLAFAWLDGAPGIQKEQFRDTIVGVVDSRWGSQKLRHRAKRELRNLSDPPDTSAAPD